MAKQCAKANILSDKWMLLLFPVITLALFMGGIVGLFAIYTIVVPLLQQAS